MQLHTSCNGDGMQKNHNIHMPQLSIADGKYLFPSRNLSSENDNKSVTGFVSRNISHWKKVSLGYLNIVQFLSESVLTWTEWTCICN